MLSLPCTVVRSDQSHTLVNVTPSSLPCVVTMLNTVPLHLSPDQFHHVILRMACRQVDQLMATRSKELLGKSALSCVLMTVHNPLPQLLHCPCGIKMILSCPMYEICLFCSRYHESLLLG